MVHHLPGTPGLDLPAGVRSQLEAADVAIEYSGGCTLEDDTLFSYRRDPTPAASPDWCGRTRADEMKHPEYAAARRRAH